MPARSRRPTPFWLLALIGLLFAFGAAQAQDIEPRSYTNAPIGMNFLIAGYAHSTGGVIFDPSVPLTDAKMKIDLAVLAYARVFELAGQSGKFDLIVPYATLNGDALYRGQPVSREVAGYGDPRLRVSLNFLGAPALDVRAFRNYKQDLIVGGSVQLSLPTGQYDPDRLVNIGTNRWSVKPELGVSKVLGRWSMELSGGVTFFGDNNDFFGGKHREQDPIYSLQEHVVYSFPSGIWAAVTAAQLSGGRTTLDGVRGNDLQKNSRIGLTLAFPIDRHHSLKLYANSGVYTRTGSDFDTVGIAWQYRWGDGY